MKILKIALLQLEPCKTPEANLEKGLRYCAEAKKLGADIALFPEMWSNGYNIYDLALNSPIDGAIPPDGNFLKEFSKLAAKLEMAIGVTYLEKRVGKPRNGFALFDRFGERRLSYAKVHTCDFGAEINLERGEDFYVCELDTACGTVKVGAMICYDREFPESARILMLKGAELILVPNACPLEINRLSQLRARAFENMLAVATCNYPETVPDCNGRSCVFDGIAYIPEKDGSRDTCVLEADGSEGIFIADIDLDILRQYRLSEVHGNAYRRPDRYGLLTDSEILQPFVRSDRRR